MLNFAQALPEHCTTLLPMMQAFYAHFAEPFDQQRTEEALTILLATPAFGRIWLIRLDTAVVGYVVVIHFFSLEYGGQTAILDELYIIPEQRDKQIGTQALAYVEAYARANSLHAISLEVDHMNPNARRLYEHVGYTTIARSMMCKRLPAAS